MYWLKTRTNQNPEPVIRASVERLESESLILANFIHEASEQAQEDDY